MPKFIITETRREIWHYFHEVEADSIDEAREAWTYDQAKLKIDDEGEYKDTVSVDIISIEEQ
jgi:hypothetical protein